jgi:hypothetical protein
MAISDANKARLNEYKSIFKRIGLGDIVQGFEEDLETVLEAATSQAAAILALQNEEVSAEITGTGAEQDVAHTLGVVPSVVLVVPSLVPDAGITVALGTHTDEVAKVTLTENAKAYVYMRA